MRKYWAFYKTSVQDALTYRGPIFIWLMNDILALVAIVAVWLSASAGETIGGYTKPELITYYVAALFLQWLVSWFPFYGTLEEIKHGEIVLTALIKPISYYWRRFAEELGWHVISSVVGLSVSLIFAFSLQNYIILDFPFLRIFLLVPVVALAIVVVFTFSLCLGLLTFWFTEIWAVDSLFWAARIILGGQGIPISFIPGIFQTMVRILPFRYMFSFPLEVYFGKLSRVEAIQGVLMQFLWIVTLVQIYKVMWRCGRRAYTAFGQ